MSDNHQINYNEINDKLFREYKSGNNDARNKIIENNMGLVKKYADVYSKKSNVSYDDLYQKGCCALIKAVDNYDLLYNNSFSTYAVNCITGSMKNCVRDSYYQINVPYNLRNIFATYNRLSSMNLSKEEIAKQMNISLDQLDEIIREYNETMVINDVLSLNVQLSNDDDKNLTLEDLCESPENSEDAINNAFREELLQKMSKILTERELQIICMRYGFNGYKMTQKEIGRIFGMTHRGISYFEKRAIKKLKLKKSIREFYEYI